MSIREFKINNFLSLELKGNKTIINVVGLPFKQCKFLLINFTVENMTSVENLKSVDEASEKLGRDLENLENSEEDLEVIKIAPEVEFWGHCSNLQVWYENNYDTRLLHSNLAFPLLKRLTEAGDPLAKKVFKEEIAKRYNSGVKSVRAYLEERNYLKFLTRKEFFSLLDSEYEIIQDLERITYKDWLKIDIKNGKVIGLTHHGNKLTEIPEPIKELRFLQKLDLSFNLINELPEWIGEFKYLEELYLNHNQLTRLPNKIGNLEKLEAFEAIGNKIKWLPDSLGNLKALKKILLFTNQIEKLPQEIGNLSSLKILKLYENELEELPKTIGKLRNLKLLSLEKNHLRILPKTIGDLYSLEMLILDDNELTSLPDELARLNSLKILSISKNQVNKLQTSYEKLISLEEVYIDSNPFKGLPNFIYRLQNLRTVDIRNTHIKKNGIAKNRFNKKNIKIVK